MVVILILNWNKNTLNWSGIIFYNKILEVKHEKDILLIGLLPSHFTCPKPEPWIDLIYFRLKTAKLNYYFFCIIHTWFDFLVWMVGFMVLNATFNNIIVLLGEKTGEPGENHWLVASHWQTLSHNAVSSSPRPDGDSNSQHQWW
jgi:hypothetical protein